MKRKRNPQWVNRTIELFLGLLVGCLVWLTSTHGTTPIPSGDNPALFYSTDHDDHLGGVFNEAIQKAQHSIQIAVYTITDQRLIQSLRKKAKEGVHVTVICDAKACPGIEKKLGSEITLYKATPKGLMHLKILVVDDELVWIGSANMTGESLRLHGNLIAGFDAPELAQWIGKKLFALADGTNDPYPQQSFLIGHQTLEFWFLPNDKGAVHRIRSLIRAAKKTIKIAMFTWTRLDFVNDIVSANLRGVDVKIVLDNNSSKGSSVGVVKALQKGKIPVRVNTGQGLLHYKTMIIDDEILVNGSANWTKAAFRQNEDCYFVLSPLNEEQREFLKEMWETIVKNSKLLPTETKGQ
jgi:phosphatidylserine/phosphatidylglycerophosphate/cardiolipin synthase-like enzyme